MDASLVNQFVQDTLTFWRNHDHKLLKKIMGKKQDPRINTILANGVLEVFHMENKELHFRVDPLLDAANIEGKKVQKCAEEYAEVGIADELKQITHITNEIAALSDKRKKLQETVNKKRLVLYNNYVHEHKDRVIKLFVLYQDTTKQSLIDRAPRIVDLCNKKMLEIQTQFKK